MVRILIPVVAVVLIWLLFFSGLSKRLRIILSTLLVVAMLFGLWLDTNDKALSTKLIAPEEVVSCGASGKYSYRTNFNIHLCLQNAATQGTVKRLVVKVAALRCVAANCKELSVVEEQINLSIAAGHQLEHTENLAFESLGENAQQLSDELLWTVEVIKVWSTKY